jgi:2'-5' RNA ligase
MMEYFIVSLIKGRAKRYHEDLRKIVAKRFDVPFVVRRRVPSHITLKYHFKTKNIKPIEDVLEEFCKYHWAAKYQLKGFGSFRKNVVFMEVLPSKQMRHLQTSLVRHLKKIRSLPWEKHEGKNIHFHASIAWGDVNENNFDPIWRFLKRYKPHFKLTFDNIAILKSQKGAWNVHKEFRLR